MDETFTGARAANPVRLHATSLGLAITILIGLCWLLYASVGQRENFEPRAFALGRLEKTLLLLNAEMTRCARFAAETGAAPWEPAYRRSALELESAIAAAVKLAPNKQAAAAANRVNTANRELVAMENRVFLLVRQGLSADALAVLESAVYRQQKELYASGIEEFASQVRLAAESRFQAQTRRLRWLLAAIFTAIGFLLITWLIGLRTVRRWHSIVLRSNLLLTRKTEEMTELNRQLDQRVAARTKDLESSRATAMNVMLAAQEAKDAAEEANRSLQREVAERKLIEESLLTKARELNRLVIDLDNQRKHERDVLASIPSLCVGVRRGATVTLWNAMAEQVFGVPAAAAVGRPFADLPLQWHWEQVENALSRSQNFGEVVHLEHVRMVDGAGRDRILSLTINRVGPGDAEGVVVVGADVTERKHLESQLVLAQKMESLGQLAAGIAHEINTPTQYVGDNTRFLRDAFGDLQACFTAFDALFGAAKAGPVPPEFLEQTEAEIESRDMKYLAAEIPRAIEESLEGLGRVSGIVQAMKNFSHPDRDEKQPADLNQAIQSTVTVSRNEWKYVADMDLDLDPALRPVPCLVGGINQVLLNLIVNAAQAIADVNGEREGVKGAIRISTGQHDGGVEIRVSDTGSGIPADVKDKIFNPFFTTKPVGKGTGQGLALAHNIIVEKHQGSIQVETEVGKGTTFIIRLPSAETAAASEGGASEEAHSVC